MLTKEMYNTTTQNQQENRTMKLLSLPQAYSSPNTEQGQEDPKDIPDKP